MAGPRERISGTARVSVKGQITIPQTLRDRLGIEPGQIVELVAEGGRLVVRHQRRRYRLDEVYGILELDGSVDEVVEVLRGSVR